MRRQDGHPAWTNPTYFHAARYLSWICPRLAADGLGISRIGTGLPIDGPVDISVQAAVDALDQAPPCPIESLPPPPSRARRVSVTRTLRSLASRRPPPQAPRLSAKWEQIDVALLPPARGERSDIVRAGREPTHDLTLALLGQGLREHSPRAWPAWSSTRSGLVPGRPGRPGTW